MTKVKITTSKAVKTPKILTIGDLPVGTIFKISSSNYGLKISPTQHLFLTENGFGTPLGSNTTFELPEDEVVDKVEMFFTFKG